MLRFQSKGGIPRHNSKDPTYLLLARKSLYCVHREITSVGYKKGESIPTKSCIVGFRYKRHAERMQQTLNEYQRQGRNIDGMVVNGKMPIDSGERGRPISILDIQSQELELVEKQCLLNYFDLWLVNDIVRIAPDEDVGPSWRLDIYEYITIEPPHRSYINHHLESLLRNSHMR